MGQVKEQESLSVARMESWMEYSKEQNLGSESRTA
jgi:hypothetical protein